MQNINAFWDQVLERFCWILAIFGAKKRKDSFAEISPPKSLKKILNGVCGTGGVWNTDFVEYGCCGIKHAVE